MRPGFSSKGEKPSFCLRHRGTQLCRWARGLETAASTQSTPASFSVRGTRLSQKASVCCVLHQGWRPHTDGDHPQPRAFTPLHVHAGARTHVSLPYGGRGRLTCTHSTPFQDWKCFPCSLWICQLRFAIQALQKGLLLWHQGQSVLIYKTFPNHLLCAGLCRYPDGLTQKPLCL